MMKDRKAKLLNDREFLSMEKQKVQNKYIQLYRHIFSVSVQIRKILII